MTAPKVLILGWIGSPNLGDELIAEAVCEMLRQEDCEPAVATIDKAASAALDVAMVRHAGALDTVGLTRALRQYDAVVFGGGGLIQDETGPLNLPFHLTRLGAARTLRKPWAGLGLGIGDVRRRTGRVLVRAVLRNPVALSVRDAASAARYLDLTGQQARLGIDPVLALEPRVTSSGTDSTDRCLVVSLRPENRPDQRSLATTGATSNDQIASWAAAIDAIAEQHKVHARFVTWDDSHDRDVHDQVAARLSCRFTIERPTAQEVINRMASGQLALTMRYHGAVAAVLGGQRSIVLDYSPKMASLCNEVGDGLKLVAPNASADRISNAATELLAGPAPIVDTITERAERVEVNRAVIAELAAAARHKR